jgi:hypothetical protein
MVKAVVVFWSRPEFDTRENLFFHFCNQSVANSTIDCGGVSEYSED